MHRLFRFLKLTIITLSSLIILIYSLLYLFLIIPSVQTKIKTIGSDILSELVETDVTIERLELRPFNRISLRNVLVVDQKQDTLLYADKIGANFNWLPLLDGELSFSTIQLMGFEAYIHQETPYAPRNIDFLLDKLKSKEKKKQNFPVRVELKNIFLRRGTFQYDLRWSPYKSQFDKNHIRVTDLLATLSLHEYSKDSLNIELKRMSFKERSGFEIDKLDFNLTANREKAQVNGLSLLLPKSSIVFDSLQVDYSKVLKKEMFADSAYFQIFNSQSKITLQDLRAFTSSLDHFSDSISMKMSAEGHINKFHLQHLSLEAENRLKIQLNGSLQNITNPAEAYINAKAEEVWITPQGSLFLLDNFREHKTENRAWSKSLGNIYFNGFLSGKTSQLRANGRLNSDLGELVTNILIGNNPQNKVLTVSGNIASDLLRIGSLTNNKLDNLTFDVAMDFVKPQNDISHGSVIGNIHSFELNNYQYNNLAINASIKDKHILGEIDLYDPNGTIQIEGEANLDPNNTFVNLYTRLDQLSLPNLNWSKKYDIGELSAIVRADFKGNQLDNAHGHIIVDTLSFTTNRGTYELNQLKIDAKNNQKPQLLTLESDLINGKVEGEFMFNVLVRQLKEIFSPTLPALIKSPKIAKSRKSQTDNNFNFNFTLFPTFDFSYIFELPFDIEEEAQIRGHINHDLKTAEARIELPRYRVGKMQMQDGDIYLIKPNEEVKFRYFTRRLNKKKEAMDITILAQTDRDNLLASIDWSNLDNPTFSGKIATSTLFPKNSKRGPLPFVTTIAPSNIIVQDSIWKLSKATILGDSSKTRINNLQLAHGGQFLKIDGTLSNHKDDSLTIDLNQVDLDYIFDIVQKDFIMFGGKGTGTFQIALENNLPKIKTDSLVVENFSYNDAPLGRLKLASSWNAEDMGIMLDGAITAPGYPATEAKGGVFLKQDSLWLNFKANHTNVAFAHIWTDKVIQDIQGYATGDLTLYGKFKEINMIGDVYSDKVSFGIEYLNTRYAVSDTIRFHHKGIAFDKVRVQDSKGQQAIAWGELKHTHFKDLSYDINIRIPDGIPFQAFNLTEKLNPLFWGEIYASGTAKIFGDTERTVIDVTAKSSRRSNFFFSLNSEATASDYQFIEFHDLDKKEVYNPYKKIKRPVVKEEVSEHELRLNLQMEATPDVEINLIMDPATGDVITGNGAGNIRVEYDPKNDFKLFGNYRIDKGSYYFNLQDVIMRDFRINQGSTVSFQGDPLGAKLDIEAIYQVTANLTDLDESFLDSKELSRPNVPVQCLLNIEGDLRRPDLSFDINLPTVSTDIDRQVKSIIGTEEMMNKQILYLMVLNKFFTPEYAKSTSSENRFNELSSMASSTLSSQLNNLLGEISDNWNIGTNIRSDKGDFSDVEVELALSSQLLNNRLLLNGNFGYRDNEQANTSFIGDFDLEYLLNPSGSFRLKAYNHYNDRNYSIKSALTTQGVGLMFKKDFDSISQLFHYFINRKRKKKTEDEKQ